MSQKTTAVLAACMALSFAVFTCNAGQLIEQPKPKETSRPLFDTLIKDNIVGLIVGAPIGALWGLLSYLGEQHLIPKNCKQYERIAKIIIARLVTHYLRRMSVKVFSKSMKKSKMYHTRSAMQFSATISDWFTYLFLHEMITPDMFLKEKLILS